MTTVQDPDGTPRQVRGNEVAPHRLRPSMRHALVCGASAGIGEATALRLAREGHRLTLLARSESALQRVADACRQAGAPAAEVLVADLDALDEAASRVAGHHEAFPIDILVNNTGGPPGGPLLETQEEDLEGAFRRHVVAAHRLAQIVVPHMAKNGWGRIVNVTSISVRQPIVGLGVSNIVRHGMAAWAKTLSKELPPGVTVNTVLPGFMDTDRLHELAGGVERRGGPPVDETLEAWADGTPEKRLGRPSELAAAVAWLAPDDASFVRGVALPVDGGRLDAI